jgi:cell division protein FtsX
MCACEFQDEFWAMKNATVIWIVFCLAVMTGILFWAYGRWNNVASYRQTFENNPRTTSNVQKDPQQQQNYHGTRESDIKKYRGNRFSTY